MRINYRIIFLRNNNGVLFYESSKVFKNPNSVIELGTKGKKHFPINLDKPSYLDRKNKVYFLDIDSREQYHFEKIKTNINSDSLDLIFSTKFMKQIAGSLNKEQKQIDWFSLIIGLLIGGLFSAFIVFFIMSGKIEQLYQTFSGNNPLPF